MIRSTAAKYRNIGILILRIGLGIMFVFHGYPKLFGGPESWEQVGSAMQVIGIESLPIVFGFLAAIAEFFGGLCLIFGLYFKTALSALMVVMVVATIYHIAAGDSFARISHPIEVFVVLVSLLFLGTGRPNLDRTLKRRRRRW